MPSRDTIYAQEISEVKDFVFDENVASVFEDMLVRSIPLYAEASQATLWLSVKFAAKNSCIYDLGCSTGSLLAELAGRVDKSVSLIGVDNSKPMLETCHEKFSGLGLSERIELHQADITELELKDTSVVVMNYTLQFLSPETRLALLQRVYKSLRPGGALILSEKITHRLESVSESLIKLHEEYKRKNGYSELEISQKRDALEKVLIPFTTEENYSLLRDAGFSSVEVFLKWYNFASFLAVKSNT